MLKKDLICLTVINYQMSVLLRNLVNMYALNFIED